MRHARRSTCAKRNAVAAAYLRAAHAYMLISIPTGTSTIFGAFQAIWHSFWNLTNSALSRTLVWKENFASESFVTDRRVFICCVAKATSVGHAMFRLKTA